MILTDYIITRIYDESMNVRYIWLLSLYYDKVELLQRIYERIDLNESGVIISLDLTYIPSINLDMIHMLYRHVSDNI